MKFVLMEKLIFVFGIAASTLASIQTDSLRVSQLINHSQTLDYKNTQIAPVVAVVPKTDTVNTDLMLREARATVEAYNKSVREKNRINRLLLSLTKKEVQQAKLTNNLIKELSTKHHLEHKYNPDDANSISELHIDTLCVSYRKPVFSKTYRCVKEEIKYYVYKGKEQIVLQTITQKR